MSESEEQAALSNSTARLYWHVFQKGFQAGAIVGAGTMALKIHAGWNSFRRSVI